MEVYSDSAVVSQFDRRLSTALHSEIAVGDFLKGEWPSGASIRLPSSGDGGKNLDYARQGHPGGQRVERLLMATEMGAHAFCFSDGMRAIAAATEAVVRPGDTILAHPALYGGSLRYLYRLVDWGVRVEFRSLAGEDASEIVASLKPKLIFTESLSNPSMQVLDLPALMRAAGRVGSHLLIDNTLATSYCCVPLDMARHCEFERLLVVLSLTKGYSAGELGGAVVTDDPNIADALYKLRQAEGGNSSPNDVPRHYDGIRTMGPRMQRLSENAGALAEFLEESKVEGITPIYPLLSSHPDVERARRLLLRGPGVVTLESDLPADRYQRLTVELEQSFLRSNSFNGTLAQMSESSRQSHGGVKDPAQLEAAGIRTQLIRLSPSSTYSAQDIIDHMRRALDLVQRDPTVG